MAIIAMVLIEGLFSVWIGYMMLVNILNFLMHSTGELPRSLLCGWLCLLLLGSIVGILFRKEVARILHNITIGAVVVSVILFTFFSYWLAVHDGMAGEWLLMLTGIIPLVLYCFWSLYFFSQKKVKEQFK